MRLPASLTGCAAHSAGSMGIMPVYGEFTGVLNVSGRLEGKVAIITGTAQWIGRAKRLAEPRLTG